MWARERRVWTRGGQVRSTCPCLVHTVRRTALGPQDASTSSALGVARAAVVVSTPRGTREELARAGGTPPGHGRCSFATKRGLPASNTLVPGRGVMQGSIAVRITPTGDVHSRATATQSHSTYRSRFVTVEYGWHPLHGRRLQARSVDRREGIVLLVEGDLHISRRLPMWMCDPATCRSMTLGPPQVRVDALAELSEVLASLLPDRAAPSSSDLPEKEAADEATDVTTTTPTPAEPGTTGPAGAAIDGAGAGSRRSSARSPGPGICDDRCDGEDR